MLVAQIYPDVKGGAEIQCWRQAKALAARGHVVTVLTRWQTDATPRWETKDGVRIGRLGWYLPLMAKRRVWILHIKQILGIAAPVGLSSHKRMEKPEQGCVSRKSLPLNFSLWLANTTFVLDLAFWVLFGPAKVDVVHAHASVWLAGFAQWAGERIHVPVFCKEASFPVLVYGQAEGIPWKESWRNLRMKCRFFAITSAIANGLKEAGIPPHRIVEIPNGVELPERMADPGNHSDAIYMGNFSQGMELKGFDVLLKAWSKAIQIEPGMRLRLFGGGNAQPWKEYAQNQGIGESVVFEGSTDDVGSAYRQGGFLLLPSRIEGLSNALLEGMASGLPAIVSDIPGNIAVVNDGVEGFVVPVGDVDLLANAMVKLFQSSTLRAQMGRAARERIQGHFSIQMVVEKLESAYGQARMECCEGISSSIGMTGIFPSSEGQTRF